MLQIEEKYEENKPNFVMGHTSVMAKLKFGIEGVHHEGYVLPVINGEEVP